MKIKLTEYENYHDSEKMTLFLSHMSEKQAGVAKIALDKFLDTYSDNISRSEAYILSSFRRDNFSLSLSDDAIHFSFYPNKEELLTPALTLMFSNGSRNSLSYNARDYFYKVGVDAAIMTQNMKKIIEANMEVLAQYHLINNNYSYLFRSNDINIRKFFSIGDSTATYDYQVARLHYTERGLFILKRQKNRARFSKISARIGFSHDDNKIAVALNLLLCGVGNNKFNVSFLANKPLTDSDMATIRERIDRSVRQEILRQLKSLKMTDAQINSNFLTYSIDEVNCYLSLAEIVSA